MSPVFGRRNKNKSPDETSEQDGAEQASRSGKGAHASKKRNEMLRSVIDDSVPGPLIDLLKENTEFLIDDTHAAVLLLHVESIGGLSKSTSKVEAKGSFVNQARADNIATVAIPSFIEQEIIGIIPNETTLSNLTEFFLFTKGANGFVPQYTWGVVDLTQFDAEKMMIDTGIETTFTDAVHVHNGDDRIQEFIDPSVISERESTQEVSLVDDIPMSFSTDEDDTDTIPVVRDEPGDFDEHVPSHAVEESIQDENEFDSMAPGSTGDYGALTVSDDDYAAAMRGDSDDELEPDDDFPEVDEESDPLGDDGDADELGDLFDTALSNVEVEPVEVEPEAVRDTVIRRFTTGDVDLVLDRSAFDALFNEDSLVLFDDNPVPEDDWLGKELLARARMFNQELRTKHQLIVDQLLSKYTEQMSLSADKFLKVTDPNNPESKYYSVKNEIDTKHRKAVSELDRLTVESNKAIEAEFEAQAQARADEAAANARNVFINMNRSVYDKKKADAAIHLTNQIEQAYQDETRLMYEGRRITLHDSFEKARNGLLEKLSEEYRESLIDLNNLYQNHHEDLLTLIEDNRQNEVARIETIRIQNEQDSRYERARADFEEQSFARQTAHELALSKLHDQIDQMRLRHDEAVRAVNQEWEAKMAERSTVMEGLAARQEELKAEVAEAEKRATDRVETAHLEEVARLKAELVRAEDSSAWTLRVQKRMTMVWLIATVLLVFFATVMGVLIGGFVLH